MRAAPGTKNTSRTASCCSWSTSPGSMPEYAIALRSTAIPTWRSSSGWVKSTIFGPTTAAFDRYASSTSARTAPGCSGGVVVEHEQVGGTVDRRHDLVHRAGEPEVGRGRHHEGVRQDGLHLGRQVARRAGVGHHDGDVGVVLGGQAAQDVGEPRAGVVRHHDGHHGRRHHRLGLGTGQLQEDRLRGRGRRGGDRPGRGRRGGDRPGRDRRVLAGGRTVVGLVAVGDLRVAVGALREVVRVRRGSRRGRIVEVVGHPRSRRSGAGGPGGGRASGDRGPGGAADASGSQGTGDRTPGRAGRTHRVSLTAGARRTPAWAGPHWPTEG